MRILTLHYVACNLYNIPLLRKKNQLIFSPKQKYIIDLSKSFEKIKKRYITKYSTRPVAIFTKGRTSKRRRKRRRNSCQFLRFNKGRILCFGEDFRQNLRVTYSRRINVRSVIKMATFLLMQRALRRERVFLVRSQQLYFLDDVNLISRQRAKRNSIYSSNEMKYK